MTPAKSRKKLIEVALPLDAINTAAAREKSIRHGHPSTLHLWWARRPLAAARAVIFAQMVDDPAEYVDELLADPAKKRAAERECDRRRAEHAAQQDSPPAPAISPPSLEAVIAEIERDRLFGILEKLVRWENTTNEAVLAPARAEIRQSWRRACADNAGHPRAKALFNPDRLPAFHDPFAGGGALPLEAQRLGLEAHASDLNPVAVLINKAMIEIPPRFAARPPVNPQSRADAELLAREWPGARGLAEDVRYYGRWMRDQAEQRIGRLYPKIRVSAEMLAERPDLKPYRGRELTVIAWLWARTVNSPNPAFAEVAVPLASTFMLSTKSGKEAYVEPVIENGGYRFRVKVGQPKDPVAAKAGTSAGKRSAFRCLMSDTPVPYNYIRDEGKAGRMGARLMAIVAEGDRGRVYLAPTAEHEAAAREAKSGWKPEVAMNQESKDLLSGRGYGFKSWHELFTSRQLVALTTFSDLVGEAMARIRADARAAGFGLSSAEALGPSSAEGLPDDDTPLHAGGSGASAYAEAVGVYLGFTVSRQANRSCTISFWDNTRQNIQQAFGRQAIPMTWDYCESNPFSNSSGNWLGQLRFPAESLDAAPAGISGFVSQQDAQQQGVSKHKLISTDPPYYDNIGYADLSDFFYVWLRHSQRSIFSDLFVTLAVPKAEELVATPYRHGGKEQAETFFLDGMTQAMRRLAEQAHPVFPVTIYYAFKQSEKKGDSGTASTGWETFLDALIRSGFAISGTWPMRTELTGNLKKNVSALASSIVLVCRPRPADAAGATRGKFVAALKRELPAALVYLQRGNIAPVDLAQAAIGPGMAVYTRFSRVLDAAGHALTVREALALINQVLDEALAEQEGDFDADSRWALAWFEQHGFSAGDYGVAETLSKAKNTSVQGLVEAGILNSQAGQVRLLKPDELPADWNPETDPRLTVWEMVHHLIRVLEAGGELAAAELVEKLGARAESVCELCYRLYTVCERKKRAAEALSYNSLVQSWPEIVRLAEEQIRQSEQSALFDERGD